MLGEAREGAGVAEGGAWTAGGRGRAAEGKGGPETDGPWVAGGLWVVAIVAAWVGTAIIYEAGAGINWAIWVTVLAAGLAWSATRKGRRLDPVALWAIGLAVLVGWGSAITDNVLFQGLIICACAALLATAARIAAGVAGNRIGVSQMLGAPVLTSVFSIFETARRAADVAGAVSGGRNRPIVRGVAIAVPIAAVFALTIAGADPTLTHWRSVIMLWVASITFVPTLVVFVFLLVLGLGTYGMAIRGSFGGSETLAFEGPSSWSIGQAERSIIIAGVAIVFGGFLALQPTYLFRNVDALRVSGMSYTEYAHQGFGELTVAAILCVLLILALDRHTRRKGQRAGHDRPLPGTLRGASADNSARPEASGSASAGDDARDDGPVWWRAWGYWGPLVLVAEVLVVLASAWHRLSVYEASYGFTTLRVYVQACIAGEGIALVLLASELSGYEGDFDGRRVARRVALAAALFLAAFSFGNPEQWVVNRNVERYNAIGKIDVPYLANLSLNAAPAVVASLGDLTPECAQFIRSRYGAYTIRQDEGWFTHTRWFEWNYRRQRGLEAVHTLLAAPSSGVTESGSCDRPPAAR